MIVEQSGFGGGSTETQFVGPNPSSNAQIIYYLKKRHTFGKMEMYIEDQEGKLVSELGAGKSKGINVVTWNYTSKAPKMAKGKTFTFGGFTAPRVEAGTYKVVIKKGKDTYSTDLIVQNDSTSLLTDEERTEKQRIVKKLFDMSEELAYMVYELDTYQKVASDLVKTDPKAKKVATPVVEKLQSLKETLVVTTGDNYVGAAEPELREKLGDLYSKIASSFDKPSNAEMENLKVLEERYENAKETFNSIKDKEVQKLAKYMEKVSISPFEVKPFEDYIESDL
jgi:hypothetical protein